MTYEETVQIKKPTYDKVNQLLDICSFSDMTDYEFESSGVRRNTCEGIYLVKFKDGSQLNYDLCSGSENYYDEIVWSKDNRDAWFEPTFDLADMDFGVDDNEYVVHIEVIG
jgi:hypothetical protein